MSKKKTTTSKPLPKKYIAINTGSDYVISIGDLKYVLDEVNSYIEIEKCDADDIENDIKVFELGNMVEMFTETRTRVYFN
jgi:hypothetical protein